MKKNETIKFKDLHAEFCKMHNTDCFFPLIDISYENIYNEEMVLVLDRYGVSVRNISTECEDGWRFKFCPACGAQIFHEEKQEKQEKQKKEPQWFVIE